MKLFPLRSNGPDAIFLGHSGSTSAHLTVVRLVKALKSAIPSVSIVYGGVYPTFHAQEIMSQHPQIDVIVRGEGEAIPPQLVASIESRDCLANVDGIAYRKGNEVCLTRSVEVIRDLHNGGNDLFPAGIPTRGRSVAGKNS